MRTALVVVILALIALFIFNPDMEDFQAFVQTQSGQILGEKLGDGALGRALSGAGSALAGRYVDRVTERNDYLIFSTYTIDLDRDAEDDEWRFLGIAGMFVETERPASLRGEE